MRSVIIYFVVLLNIISSFLCISREAYCGNKHINKDKAIEIANNEAISLGYKIESINVVKVTKYKTPWNEYLTKEGRDQYALNEKNKLINKEYWAVYYIDPKAKKGGDLCIFIDYRNGDVITYIRWK